MRNFFKSRTNSRVHGLRNASIWCGHNNYVKTRRLSKSHHCSLKGEISDLAGGNSYHAQLLSRAHISKWEQLLDVADSNKIHTLQIVFKWRFDRRSGNCNSTNCKLIWEKSGTSTKFEPMTSALALQFSTNWAMKTHTLGAGHFAEKKNIRDFSDFLGLISNCFNYRYDDHILILKNCISAVHIIFITSFDSHSWAPAFIYLSLIFVSQFFLSIQYVHFYFIRWEL